MVVILSSGTLVPTGTSEVELVRGSMVGQILSLCRLGYWHIFLVVVIIWYWSGILFSDQ
jgi:hypothetical protein